MNQITKRCTAVVVCSALIAISPGTASYTAFAGAFSRPLESNVGRPANVGGVTFSSHHAGIDSVRSADPSTSLLNIQDLGLLHLSGNWQLGTQPATVSWNSSIAAVGDGAAHQANINIASAGGFSTTLIPATPGNITGAGIFQQINNFVGTLVGQGSTDAIVQQTGRLFNGEQNHAETIGGITTGQESTQSAGFGMEGGIALHAATPVSQQASTHIAVPTAQAPLPDSPHMAEASSGFLLFLLPLRAIKTLRNWAQRKRSQPKPSGADLSTAPKFSARLNHPPGFRARRALNAVSLGLMYTSVYMGRYNLSVANGSISKEYGFSHAQMGEIITAWSLIYACGQIFNGLITDRIGGKRAMLIGAAGTILMNFLFGAASVWASLFLFIAIRAVDGYFQSFCSPGLTKMMGDWFAKSERGRFSGLFGFMISLGRLGIFTLGPGMLAGFTLLGMIHIPPLHWRWLFWTPSIILGIMAVWMALVVKETPEAAGYHNVIPDGADSGVRVDLRTIIRTVTRNPNVWIIAATYAQTGAVRQAVDQWFPRYMEDAYKMDMHSAKFQFLAFLIPLVASVGSLLAGFSSDLIFNGRRWPVAMIVFFLETAVILLAAQFHTVNMAILFLLLISLTVNSTHSILGTAASMDIGGRKMTGFTVGIIDAFQYFGGSLAGVLLGYLLDKSLGNYFYFMAPFGFIGGLLMLIFRKRLP